MRNQELSPILLDAGFLNSTPKKTMKQLLKAKSQVSLAVSN